MEEKAVWNHKHKQIFTSVALLDELTILDESRTHLMYEDIHFTIHKIWHLGALQGQHTHTPDNMVHYQDQGD